MSITRSTKAERFLLATRFDCEQHIQRFGYKTNADGTAIGLDNISAKEPFTVKTLNRMDKLINERRRDMDTLLKMAIIDSEEYSRKLQVLNMMQATV